MMEGLLAVICLLLVVLSRVIYQLIIVIKDLPESISKYLLASISNKIDQLIKEVDDIKDDLGMD